MITKISEPKRLEAHPAFIGHRAFDPLPHHSPPHVKTGQWRFAFPNGYGASVVRHGIEDGLFELAVRGRNGRLCYDTAVTNDVCGRCTEEEILGLLAKIEALEVAE